MKSSAITDIIDEILFALSQDTTITDKSAFHKLKNEIFAKYSVAHGPTHIAMIERYQELVSSQKIPESLRIRKILRKRAVRSLSWVSVISLLTKFWWCPWKCIYCPTYEWLPKSYISDEPAVQRAEMNAFDPTLQIHNRLASLTMTGNAISKCDVRIIGGTWSVYPRKYQEDFVRDIYDAHSSFWLSSSEQGRSQTLEQAKDRNETAESRVIGMAIETRPDWIDLAEIVRLRRYGVTRVEVGYQTTHDYINTLNKRWHGNIESIQATKLLKDAGFKVVAHMMPWLVGSTPELDQQSMREIFDNPDFRPDELKIYPLVVTPNSELTTMWEQWQFEPYDDKILIPLMADLQAMIPEYVRLNRVYRDIPAHEILAGSKMANMRQVTEFHMKKRWLKRHDISAREIRAKSNNPDDAVLEIDHYEASGWHEYFLQMIDPHDRTIFGLCRLRIPSQIFSWQEHPIEALQGSAIVRELHVFGDQIPVGYTGNHSWQHQGFGKKMMQKAYDIVRTKYPSVKSLAVIAWVGVRLYYQKLWYKRRWEYMSRDIDRDDN